MASQVPTSSPPAGVYGPSWVSAVDPTVPIFGNPTTQSVRSNFSIIKQELEQIAQQVGLGYPIPVSDGGTGASTTPQGLQNLGIDAYLQQYLNNLFGGPLPLAINVGGTGANNIFQARINLGAAPIASPNFTGVPTAPTPSSADSSNALATTLYVTTAINNMVPVPIARGGTGAQTAPQALVNLGAAPINNPTFTGVPFAPNPNPGTANQQIATTAFVMAAVGSGGGGGTAPPVTYGPTAPTNPVVGQLWFDTTTSTLMIWSGSAWTVTVPAGAAGPPGPPGTNFVSDNPPAIPPAVAGNMWWDSSNGQLYVLFNNQGSNLIWVIANNQPGPAGPAGATGPAGPTGPPGTPWPEAPTDGSLYGRDGATTSWQLVPPEAPLGGLGYLRVGGNQSNPGSWEAGLPITGGTLTGALTLDANATAALQAVPLQQLQATVNALSVVGATAPTNPNIGQLWWNTNDGQGYVWTGGQWVVYVNPPLGSYLPLAGGTMTGPTNLVGVTNGSNAAAGQVGEYRSQVIPVGSAIGVTNGTLATIFALSLTPGDWDVWAEFWTNPSGNIIVVFSAMINTTQTAITSPSDGTGISQLAGGLTLGQSILPVVRVRQSLTATTTIYGLAVVSFASGTCSVYGKLCARRVR